jgi:aldose 1-epimerase
MAHSFRRPFGVDAAGVPVELLTLDNGLLSCDILTFGATLRALSVPTRDGSRTDVVLGYDTLEEYRARDGYFGAMVGRYANRIAQGRFSLGDQTYRLAVNNGPNHLHGGIVGFSHQTWTVEELAQDRAVLSLFSPDGQEGYPGNLRVHVTYQLEGYALSIRWQAQSDRDTVCNLTNHSYFNLAGHASGPVLDQELQLFASHYTPSDQTGIPTGAVEPVAGTPMDLRHMTPLGASIDVSFPQLLQGHGYDHNYVIDGPNGQLRPAAKAYAPKTGVTMEVDTTLPGIQLYTANYLDEGRPGKDGASYGPRHAFCLETQFYPDTPNHPDFPSAFLPAGEVMDHTTQFRFSVR